MPILLPAVIAEAMEAVQRLDMPGRLQLTDEIYRHQPHLLGSVLVLHRYFGASLQQIDPLLQLLILTWQAMKVSGHAWPLITEQLQDDCLHRLAVKMRFSEGMSPALLNQATQQHIDGHPEPYLLAVVLEQLRKQGWDKVKDDTVERIVMAALNLAECVAAIAVAPPYHHASHGG